MSTLAPYLDILRQTQADQVVIAPGMPVAVHVGGRGPALGGAPVSAGTISALVQELASPAQLRAVAPEAPVEVTCEHAGVEYRVVLSRRGTELVVTLLPAGRHAVSQLGQPAANRPVTSKREEVANRPLSRPREEVANHPSTRPPDPVAAPQEVRSSEASSPRGGVGPHRIDELLRIMLARKASDLHLSSQTAPVLRVDGGIEFLQERGPLSSEQIHGLVWEIMTEKARADFTELRDADCAYELAGSARFRVNVFQDHKGIGAVLRQIPITIIEAEKLGLPKACLDLCSLSKGLVVVTGPTGSGKSTSLAAMVDYINKHRCDHIITIEDPVEFVHPNIKCLVNQREVGVHTESFKNALRAALREDPDIVLVGEMRDLETIAIAIETAETGHLVFGTLHTTTATSTVDRIIDQFPADRQSQIRVMLSESLKGVVAQVLCKKKGGGRVAAHEILLGTTAVSALIREGKTFQLPSVMQTSKAHGMVTMNDALMSLVQRNLIEPGEAYLKAVDKAGLVNMFKNAGLPTSFG